MSNRRLWYYPNPSHKTGTTEAGPPAWHPDKTACPEDLGLEERERLVRDSVAQSDDPCDPVRFAVRRLGNELQWFTTRLTGEHPDGRVEIHGYPFQPGQPKIPPSVLRKLRDAGIITRAEYRKVVRS
jgi:hypothetical protein